MSNNQNVNTTTTHDVTMTDSKDLPESQTKLEPIELDLVKAQGVADFIMSDCVPNVPVMQVNGIIQDLQEIYNAYGHNLALLKGLLENKP